MSTGRATATVQGVELSGSPEARSERGLEASGSVGIGKVNKIWNMGLKNIDRL
jgi:hypothetical protein